MSHCTTRVRCCATILLALLLGGAAPLAAGEAAQARRPPTIEQQAAENLLHFYKIQNQVRQDQRRFLADRHFGVGKAHFDMRHYNAARRQFEQALELNPHHKAAQVYLHKSRGLLGLTGRGPGSMLGAILDQRRVADEMHKAELANLEVKARTLYHEERYAEAIEAFTRLAAQARYFSRFIDSARLAEEAEVAIRKCNAAIEARRRREAELRMQEAERVARELRERRESAVGERHRTLLEQARSLFDQHRYSEARKVCDAILAEDRTDGAAEALRTRAVETSRNAEIEKAVRARKVETERHWRLTDAACVPQYDLVSISRERYEEVLRRKVPTLGDATRDAPEWEKRIREAMGKPISFDFVETPLQDVISFLNTLSGVTIVVDNKAIRDEAPTVTLKVNEMRLEKALTWVCKLVGLKYMLRDEAIFISTEVHAEPELRMYDISDITINIQNFKGKQSALATDSGYQSTGGGTGGNTGFDGADFFPPDDDDDEEEKFTGEDLVEFIKRTIAPGTWRDDEHEGPGRIEAWQ